MYRQTFGAKIQSREGNSPDRTLRSLSNHFVEKELPRAMTTRRWAWKQPSFEESVIAHWSSSMAPKMYRGSSDSPKRRDSSENESVAERSVNRKGFGDKRPGDLRSENADMSNEKSSEKHDRLPVEGFLRSVNLRRVIRSLRNPRGR